MQRKIANILATLAACAAVVPAAQASDPAPQQLRTPQQARLALATNDVTSEDLSRIQLSAASLTYGAGAIDPVNRRIELERAPRGTEFEICRHEEAVSFVDATAHTFFVCQP